jgi:Cytidylate kinase-like family
MGVWTIAAQEGTGGTFVAAELAARAGVALLDRTTLAHAAHELDPAFPEDDDLQKRVGGRLNALALSTAITTGSPDVFREIQLRKTLPTLGRAVLEEAAHAPCVIYAAAAFAALSTHCSAIHVRLWAPLEWRTAAYQRRHLVDRRCAEKTLRHDDHREQAWVKSLYGVDLDDPQHFSLVLDASRFSPERLVETMLAAGSVHAMVGAT